MNKEEKCEFSGCDKSATGKRWGKDGTGKTFCENHDEECKKAWETSAAAIMSFWIKANGGAKKLAKSF